MTALAGALATALIVMLAARFALRSAFFAIPLESDAPRH
jgi:hypothetical protein